MDNTDYVHMTEEAMQNIDVKKQNKDLTKMQKAKWPENRKPMKKNFTSKAPVLFGKLKDH